MILPLVVLLAQAPVTTTVTKTAEGGETVTVEVNGVRAGRRVDPDGSLYNLVWERDPRTLGLTRRLHAHKVTEPFPAERDPLPVPPEAPRDAVAPPGDTTPVVIDVNWFYSAAAGAAWGIANLPAQMALSCSLANQTYANSGLPWVTWRCFGPFPASYLESSGVNPLSWMTGAGKAEIDAKFVTTGADAAHMVTTNNACGQGYYFSSTGAWAYSQSDRTCTNSNLTFPHETGHGLNYRHDPKTEGCTAISPASGLVYCTGQKYYGHAWPPAPLTPKWRSIMAYPAAEGTRVTEISNPNETNNGYPTGVPNERDNASIAVLNAGTVSRFRTPVTPAPSAPVNHVR